jgi:succinate dehydrogenase/fumarate reductase flavoprotein subunit
MKDSYDVVVIGAGIGGLSAGALLAKKGLPWPYSSPSLSGRILHQLPQEGVYI